LSLDTVARQLAERSWAGAISLALRFVLALALLALIVQAAIVVRARPQDLVTGAYGMADIIRRAMPPDFGKIDMVWWPASSWPCHWRFSPPLTSPRRAGFITPHAV
jgi:hypothetical protein